MLACYPAIDPARVSVIYNGIDSEQYRPDPATDVLVRHGIDPERPSVVFVGRITRQKGVTYALDAALQFDPGAQFVLCAGAPDTPEIAAEIEAKVARVRSERGNIVWIDQMLPRPDVVQILSHATVFLCPSIYEPLGIVNLEAMACETAVVATRTGGIPEVVEDGETGLLVPFEPRDDGSRDPVDPARFATRHRRARERARWPIQRARSAWARPAGGARSSTSPGRRSRSKRSTSTSVSAPPTSEHPGSGPHGAGLTPSVRTWHLGVHLSVHAALRLCCDLGRRPPRPTLASPTVRFSACLEASRPVRTLGARSARSGSDPHGAGLTPSVRPEGSLW